MTTRRDFLKNFALTAAGLYLAPKTLIFDMGAHTGLYLGSYEDAPYEEAFFFESYSSLSVTHIRKSARLPLPFPPRRFYPNKLGELVEVLPSRSPYSGKFAEFFEQLPRG